jgi:hypothetical protein
LKRTTSTSASSVDRQFLLFLVTFVAFITVVPVVLWTIGQFSMRAYFTVSFIWLLVSSEVFAPSRPKADWWTRLQWIKAGGWVILGYIVLERVIASLG